MATTTDSDEITSLDKLLPQDPNFPSIAYQAHEHTPICIPWTKHAVALGIGLDSSMVTKQNSNDGAFRPSALIATPAEVTYQIDPIGNSSSISQASSTQRATSYEHMDFKGTLSAGGSVLGASGRGEFSKSVYNNTDSNKISLKASLRIGRIRSVQSPSLSADALALLRTSPASFHEKYGDYYLDTLCLGADTATFLSTSSSIDLQAEMRNIQIKAKFLGFEKTVYDENTSSSAESTDYNLTFCGFDTLSGYQKDAGATDALSYMGIYAEAVRNVAYGMNLDKRAADTLQALNLGPKVQSGDVAEVTTQQCDAV